MQITKPVVCQYCHELMEYVKKDDFWKCSNCGGEFWLLNTSPVEDKKVIEEAFENGYISRALLPGCEIPPGGNRKGKNRSKAEQMKKRTPQKLFEKLFKQT